MPEPIPGYSVNIDAGGYVLNYRTDEVHNVALICEMHPSRPPTPWP